MNKKQLVYECASEPVFQARIEIGKILSKRDFEKVDDILSVAQRQAGSWAVRAVEIDARTVSCAAQAMKRFGEGE